jgi:hypothetical protein
MTLTFTRAQGTVTTQDPSQIVTGMFGVQGCFRATGYMNVFPTLAFPRKTILRIRNPLRRVSARSAVIDLRCQKSGNMV